MSKKVLKAPFTYFGSKSQIAGEVWKRLGDPEYYIEPFFGSGAMLLARPRSRYIGNMGHELVNDADAFISNFWRAVSASPEQVARYADWIVSEPDLHARHGYLVKRRRHLADHLMGDKNYFNAKVAGYWVWGMSAWIGGGFCAGKGPWVQRDGKLVRAEKDRKGKGVHRKIPHLTSGRGINRQLPHLTSGQGINRQIPHLSGGRGINVSVGGDGHVEAYYQHALKIMTELQQRLRAVIVTCGDWKRLCKTVNRVIEAGSEVAVFLDPPYDASEWTHDGYSETCVFSEVMDWALEVGSNPLAKIAFCGYMAGKQKPPKGWEVLRWKAQGGYGSQGEGRGRENAAKETIWFSPACIVGPPQRKMNPIFGD